MASETFSEDGPDSGTILTPSPTVAGNFRGDSHPLTAIMGLGTAFPDAIYSQDEIAKLFAITNPTVTKLMASGHIKTRRLYLPPLDGLTGEISFEKPSDLHRKFKDGILDIGIKAACEAINNAGLDVGAIDVLIAVTSTGFAVPGMSSLVSRTLKMKENLHRMDLVGMGCNAGMSALYAATQMSQSKPDQNILLLCCEINSASYVRDNTVRTGIVNSLFGDGAAAVVLSSNHRSQSAATDNGPITPKILDFESFTFPDQHAAMQFTWDEEQNKWSFYLSKEIPFVMGMNVSTPVDRLFDRNNITKQDVKHWVMHTGGGAVIDGAKKSLGLSEFDVRHTRSVLRDFGNISSGSFFVSLQRLEHEGNIVQGDLGVFIAMGPGATIEAALVRWD